MSRFYLLYIYILSYYPFVIEFQANSGLEKGHSQMFARKMKNCWIRNFSLQPRAKSPPMQIVGLTLSDYPNGPPQATVCASVICCSLLLIGNKLLALPNTTGE